jgi:hypothetical protein
MRADGGRSSCRRGFGAVMLGKQRRRQVKPVEKRERKVPRCAGHEVKLAARAGARGTPARRTERLQQPWRT